MQRVLSPVTHPAMHQRIMVGSTYTINDQYTAHAWFAFPLNLLRITHHPHAYACMHHSYCLDASPTPHHAPTDMSLFIVSPLPSLPSP